MKYEIDDENMYTDIVCCECESEFHIKVMYSEHDPKYCPFCSESILEEDEIEE